MSELEKYQKYYSSNLVEIDNEIVFTENLDLALQAVFWNAALISLGIPLILSIFSFFTFSPLFIILFALLSLLGIRSIIGLTPQKTMKEALTQFQIIEENSLLI